MDINWDAIGAIGELVSAVAVVSTLIYLGRQLHSTAKQQKLDGHRGISEEFNRINELWLDLEKSGMLVRAWSDWDAATAQEQHLAWVFFTKVFNHLQTMFFMWEADAIDDEVYLAEEQATCQFLATNGGRVWWDTNRAGLANRFSDRIQTAFDAEQHVPVTELLPFWKPEHWPA